jgi:hypothetical protein
VIEEKLKDWLGEVWFVPIAVVSPSEDHSHQLLHEDENSERHQPLIYALHWVTGFNQCFDVIYESSGKPWISYGMAIPGRSARPSAVFLYICRFRARRRGRFPDSSQQTLNRQLFHNQRQTFAFQFKL